MTIPPLNPSNQDSHGNTADAAALPDRLQRNAQVNGEDVLYQFANGFRLKTETLRKQDKWRILPLGSPQGSLMNHVLNFPEIARDKRVFEPFAGSGSLGFTALRAGASHVDFLDINPRAAEFHQANASLNQVSTNRFTSITGDIARFIPEHKYHLILANPPFVPTPDDIDGAITSDGGPEGNRFVNLLLERLEMLLEPSGKALIYTFQVMKDDQPLVTQQLARMLRNRPVEITPAQAQSSSFEAFCEGYRTLFPNDTSAIANWRSHLVQQYGSELALSHYIIDIGAQSDTPTTCVIHKNFAEKFGATFFIGAGREEAIAFERASENRVVAD